MNEYSYLMPGGRLAQGSAPSPRARLPFDVVVLAAEEYQPDLPGYPVVMHVPLDDGPPPDKVTRMRIRSAARKVSDHVRLGDRVLVTCWQGRNRSGVIAGLALVNMGVPGERAVHRIQRLRDGLRNPYFRAMVRGTF
jgi:protein-tyrosine phosphatase